MMVVISPYLKQMWKGSIRHRIIQHAGSIVSQNIWECTSPGERIQVLCKGGGGIGKALVTDHSLFFFHLTSTTGPFSSPEYVSLNATSTCG